MTERLHDVPTSTHAASGLDPRPNGALAFALYGPMIVSSFDGSNGVGWTVGVSDMNVKRYAQASGVSQSGLFSPAFDGSGQGWSDFAAIDNPYPPPATSPRKLATATFCFSGRHAISNLGDAYDLCAINRWRNGDTARVLPTGYVGSSADVAVGLFNLPTSTGNFSVTGLGFQPDVVILLGAHNASRDNGCAFEVGAFDADGNQWALAERSVYNSGPSFLGGLLNKVTRMSRLRSDRCLYHIGAQEGGGPTSVTQSAAFVSMDADGFTLDFDAVGLDSGGTVSRCTYYALKMPEDGAASVGIGAQNDASIDAGFAPDLMYFFSNLSAVETQTTNAFLAVGAADEAKQRGFWGGANSGATGGGPPVSFGAFSTAYALYLSGAEGEVTLTETGCDIDWVTSDATIRLFGWIALNSGEDVESSIPTATTEVAEASCGTATMCGTVDPAGEVVDVFFDYGPTIAYGTTVAAGTLSDAEDLVCATVFGLSVGSTYHWRVRITFAGGTCTVNGADATFTVGPCAEGLRVITQESADPSYSTPDLTILNIP